MRSQSSQHFDSAETIKEGIESYYQAAKPVIAYYEKKAQLCKVNWLTFWIKWLLFTSII